MLTLWKINFTLFFQGKLFFAAKPHQDGSPGTRKLWDIIETLSCFSHFLQTTLPSTTASFPCTKTQPVTFSLCSEIEAATSAQCRLPEVTSATRGTPWCRLQEATATATGTRESKPDVTSDPFRHRPSPNLNLNPSLNQNPSFNHCKNDLHVFFGVFTWFATALKETGFRACGEQTQIPNLFILDLGNFTFSCSFG